MDFEPIALQEQIRVTTETPEGKPERCTITLSAEPSPEWTTEFESFPWEQCGLAPDQYPKVTQMGLEVPALPKPQLDDVLNKVQAAMNETNRHEAERLRNLGPGPVEVYAEWFSQQQEPPY